MKITTEQKRQIAEAANEYWDYHDGETGYESRDAFIEKVTNVTTLMTEKGNYDLNLKDTLLYCAMVAQVAQMPLDEYVETLQRWGI